MFVVYRVDCKNTIKKDKPLRNDLRTALQIIHHQENPQEQRRPKRHRAGRPCLAKGSLFVKRLIQTIDKRGDQTHKAPAKRFVDRRVY